MARLRPSLASLVLLLGTGAAWAADDQALMRTLDQRACERCMLQDADLVHADLRDARLQGQLIQPGQPPAIEDHRGDRLILQLEVDALGEQPRL